MENNNLDPRLENQSQDGNQEITDTEKLNTEDSPEEIVDAAEETEPEQKPKGNRARSVISSLYDYAEIFALSIVAVIIVFSFCLRLCRVDGHSMQTTLYDGEKIIAHDIFYTPKQGDIVVFHLVNDSFRRPLVKRVIATGGQTVEINFTDKIIKVDGVIYSDEHAYIEGGEYEIKLDFDSSNIQSSGGKLYYRATVPEGKLFVLGDNRNNSTDSRSVHVGFVDEDCVLGKAILRLDPFTIFD